MRGRSVIGRIPAFVLAGALALFLFVPRAGEVYELQLKAFDFHARAQAKRPASDVAVVRITDDDYGALFRQTSPLDTAVLNTIIAAVAAGGPSAIGIDLDTPAYRQRMAANEGRTIPIVTSVELDSGGPRCNAHTGACAGTKARGSSAASLAGTGYSGIAALRADVDWVIRRYAPLLAIASDSLPTFSTAVLSAAGKTTGGWKSGIFVRGQVSRVRERLIDFRTTDARVSLSASELLRIAQSPAYRERGPLRDKVVLIGGNYRAARDQHITPLGMMAGVDIWAQVIETELEGGGYVPPHWFWPVALQLLSVTLVILLFRTASLRVAVLTGLIALPVLALLCGQLVFGSAWHALYFFPSMIVILFWELYDRASDYLKLLKKQQAAK